MMVLESEELSSSKQLLDNNTDIIIREERDHDDDDDDEIVPLKNNKNINQQEEVEEEVMDESTQLINNNNDNHPKSSYTLTLNGDDKDHGKEHIIDKDIEIVDEAMNGSNQKEEVEEEAVVEEVGQAQHLEEVSINDINNVGEDDKIVEEKVVQVEEEAEEEDIKSLSSDGSSMGFEDITLEDENNIPDTPTNIKNKPTTESPFKKLLTNKFKSFTLSTSPGSLFGQTQHNDDHHQLESDTLSSSPSKSSRSFIDKYHTFPRGSPSHALHSSPNLKIFNPSTPDKSVITTTTATTPSITVTTPTKTTNQIVSSSSMITLPTTISPINNTTATSTTTNHHQYVPFNQFSNGHNNLLFQSTNSYGRPPNTSSYITNNNNNINISTTSISSTSSSSPSSTINSTSTTNTNININASSSSSSTTATTTTTEENNHPQQLHTPSKILSYMTSTHHQSDPSVLAHNNFSSLTRPVLSSDTTKISSRILFLLALSIFFSVSNLYYIQPLLNMVGEEFNQSPTVLSIVTMSVQFGYAFGLLFISILGDLYSKKKLILILSIITSASLVGVGLSPNIVVMIIFQFLVGATTIIPHIAIPLAVDLTNPSERGGIVGILMSSLFVGLLGARVLSGILGALIGWRILYFIAASTMFIVSILLFIFLPYNPRNQEPMPYSKLLLSIVNLVKSNDQLKQTCFIGACIFSTFCILWTTLSFRLNSEPYEYPSGFIGLFGLIGMAGAIAAPIVGKLSDRTNVHLLMVISILICVVGYILLLTLDSHLIAIIAGIFILDLGVQSCHITNQSRNYKMGDTSKSRINACYMASYFIGGSLGSGICGILYDRWGWSGTSVVALVFLGLAMTCHLMYYNANSTSGNGNNNNEYQEMNDFNTPQSIQHHHQQQQQQQQQEQKLLQQHRQHHHYIELHDEVEEDEGHDHSSSYSAH